MCSHRNGSASKKLATLDVNMNLKYMYMYSIIRTCTEAALMNFMAVCITFIVHDSSSDGQRWKAPEYQCRMIIG